MKTQFSRRNLSSAQLQWSVRLLGIIGIVFASHNPLMGHSPVDYLETFKVAAGVPIEHGVELACAKVFERQMLQVEGPMLLSASIGCMGKSAPKQGAFLNWYEVQGKAPEGEMEIAVLDFVRGGNNTELQVSRRPDYFLSPAQLLAEGNPDPIPGGLDHYVAFRIIKAQDVEKDVKFGESLLGRASASIEKAAFLCLPAEEWHHDEHMEVSHRLNCFVVFELSSQKPSQEMKVSTLDQFGLNQLQLEESRWLAVKGAILEKQSK